MTALILTEATRARAVCEIAGAHSATLRGDGKEGYRRIPHQKQKASLAGGGLRGARAGDGCHHPAPESRAATDGVS